MTFMLFALVSDMPSSGMPQCLRETYQKDFINEQNL